MGELKESAELPTTECVIANGSVIIGGYVQVYEAAEQRMYLAHRLAWMKANGPIPYGLFVCHRCDNPACHNVQHLFLGTHAENMEDMVRKGRQAKPGLAPECRKGHPKRMYGGRWRCPTCHCDSAQRNRGRMRPAPAHTVETEPEDATCAECGNASSVRFPISTRLWRCMACAERQG